ncbi:MAG: hypothetical protein IIY52_00335 [Solobacterium sp.]|nr:sodium:glutamate symporter [Erysipelotrichaceae bacterium]MBQ1324442.1 hypothetical protein [Solobacterium sp.]MBQ6592345.1 hypothetical protein [Solobacterium sp.]MBR0479033.1 hypothetical protein [Solobacterium sp.]
MTSGLLQELLMQCALLGGFLLIGMFLRAKVPFFRKMLLPASVIGGFLAMLIGPNIWGERSLISGSSVSLWSLLPSILIVPIFASVPLGKGLNEKSPGLKENLPKVLVSCGLFSAASCMQTLAGLGFTLAAASFFPSLHLYRIFGMEMSQGFAGGHGTAAGWGAILQGYGLDYWETSQGIATTYATIGLIGGMLLGIFFINRASRRGDTMILEQPSDIPAAVSYGFTRNTEEQRSFGRQTTDSSSIETITVHLSIIIGVSALAYRLLALIRQWNIPGLTSIPVWFYALLLMYAVNGLLKKLKLNWLIDTRVRARIVGSMSDFAITAAIASMPIKAVAVYLVPILIISLIGFVMTYFLCFPLYRWCFGKYDYPFERAIMSWGVNTGVTINGMMLLKICDPDYSSPALNDFSMGFALMSIVSMLTSPIYYSLLENGSTLANFGWAGVMVLIYTVMFLAGRVMLKRQKPQTKGLTY